MLDFIIVIFAIVGTIFLGLFTYLKNPNNATNKLFFYFSISIALYNFANHLALNQSTDQLTLFWIRLVIALALVINVLFFLFVSAFPLNSLKMRRSLLFLSLATTLLLIPLTFTNFIFKEVVSHTTQPVPGSGIFTFLLHTILLLGGGFFVLIKKFRKSQGVEKVQIKFFLLATILLFLCILLTNLIFVIVLHTTAYVGLLPIYTLLFIAVVTYTIVKHRFLEVRLIVARSVMYSLLVFILAVYYAGSIFLIGRFLIHNNPTAEFVTSTVLALTMALSFQPLRRFLEKVTDAFLYKERYDSHRVLANFSHILSGTLNLDELVEKALTELVTEVRLSTAFIVLTKNSRINWSLGVSKTPKWSTNDKGIVPLIMKAIVSDNHENILVFDELPEGNEKQMMRERDLNIVLPLVVKDEVIGALLLGEKASGDIYSVEDIELLKILAPEIALAVKNAESYEEIRKFNMTLEQKVQEATEQYKKVNEQMYGKNLELNERNKTLSLLRRLDEIILGSVTDTRQIAQQVSAAAVSEIGFKAILISLVDREQNSLMELALEPEEILAGVEMSFNRNLHGVKTSLNEDGNVEVTAVKTRKMQIVHDLHGLLNPHFTYEESVKVQESVGIHCVLIYPLIVRGEVIGTMSIGIAENEKDMTVYQKDIIERLVNVMGIAIDNALLYQKIQEANERLKEVDKLKDEFVSVASHELRTPMTAIKSYLWLALAGKGGVLTDKQRFYLERSYNSTNRLIKLVNDMLNVSRIESGRMDFDMAKVDLGKLVEDIIGEVQPRADELGLKIVIDKDSMKNLPPVIADSDKIKEIVVNLVGNSLKFTQRGGSISLKSELKDDTIVTHVTDTGQGIAADDIPKLFQKFSLIKDSYQTNQAASQGTGLGLYICKSIMKAHHGDIWAESPGKGRGATFSFSLKTFNEHEYRDLQQLNKGVEGLGIIHSEV